MFRREAGSLAHIEGGLDRSEAADVYSGREAAKLKSKEHAVKLQKIKKGMTAAELDVSGLADERHKVAAVDITAVAERMAKTKARKQSEEYANDPKVSKWNLLRRAWRRDSERGKELEYRKQAADEIIKRQNLLENKEKGYELADEMVESVVDPTLRAAEENPELFVGANAPQLDALGAELITDFVTGSIKTREDFDEGVRLKLLPIMLGKEPKDFDKTLYASNLFHVAAEYKHQFREKLQIAEDEFGPEQAELVRKYMVKVFRLDISLAKRGADLYEMKPNSKVLGLMEGAINWTQSPIFDAYRQRLGKKIEDSKFGQSKFGQKVNKALALVTGNPLLYAYLGNRLAYMAASGTGALAVKAAGAGAVAVLGVGPGIALAAGAAAGAGLYMGIRASVERLRAIRRREEQAILGQRPEEITQADARIAEVNLRKLIGILGGETGILTDDQVSDAAATMATLELQDKLKKNLFNVGKGEGKDYETNFLAVQDLRRAIVEFRKKFSEKIPGEDLDILVRQAETELMKGIENKDQKLAAEIRRQGVVRGVLGFCTTFTAALLMPGAKKLMEEGWNKAADSMGATNLHHFDTSKVTFTEELWYRIKGVGNGEWAVPTQVGANGDLITLPAGAKLITNQVPGHFTIVDQYGQAYPDVQVPLDASNHITDHNAFSTLISKYHWKVESWVQQGPKTGTGGSGGNFDSWINGVKTSGGHGVNVVDAHTTGMYDNPDVVNGHIVNSPNIENELRMHIVKQGGGDVALKLDVHNTNFATGSHRIVHGSVEQPDMSAMFNAGKLKFVIIPDAAHPHDAIFLDIDPSGNAVIPSGSKLQDLLDPTTGRFRHGILFGTAQVEARPGGGMDMTWVNADHGDSVLPMDYGHVAGNLDGGSQLITGYRLCPPTHEFGDPDALALAADKRLGDTDIDRQRAKRAQEEDRMQREKFRADMLKNHPNPEGRLVMAQAELQRRIRAGGLAEAVFGDVVNRYVLENDPERQEFLLRAILGMTEGQIDQALANQQHAFEAAHRIPAGGGGGGGETEGGGHGDHHAPAAAPTAERPKFDRVSGLLKILVDRQRETRTPRQRVDRESLREVNRRGSIGPHLEFDAEDSMLQGANAGETKSKAVDIYNFIRDENLDTGFYRGKKGTIFKIKFAEADASPIENANDGSVTFIVGPNSSAQLVGASILQRLRSLEGATGELKHRGELADRSVLDRINNHDHNQYPHLEFTPASEDLLIGIDRARVDSLAEGVFNRYQAADLGRKGKYKVSNVIFKINRDGSGQDGLENGALVIHARFTDSPASVFTNLESQLATQAAEAKPEQEFLDTINSDGANEEPHLEFAAADETLLKGNDAERAKALAKGILRLIDASGLRDYSLRDKIFRIEMARTGPYTLTQEGGFTLLPVNYKDSPASVFLRIRKDLEGQEESGRQPKFVTDVNNSGSNKEPPFTYSFDAASLKAVRVPELQKRLNAINTGLRAHPDIVSGKLKDALVEVNFVQPGSTTAGKARREGEVIIVDVSYKSNVNAAQRLIIEGIRAMEDQGAKS